MIESDYYRYKRTDKDNFKNPYNRTISNIEMFDSIVSCYYSSCYYSDHTESYIMVSEGDYIICKIDNTKIADGTLYKYISKCEMILTSKDYKYTWLILENKIRSKENLIEKIKANVGKQLNYSMILEFYNGFLYNEYDLNKFICPNNNIESPKLATTELFGDYIDAKYQATLYYKGKEIKEVQILCDDYWNIVGVYDNDKGYTLF